MPHSEHSDADSDSKQGLNTPPTSQKACQPQQQKPPYTPAQPQEIHPQGGYTPQQDKYPPQQGTYPPQFQQPYVSPAPAVMYPPQVQSAYHPSQPPQQVVYTQGQVVYQLPQNTKVSWLSTVEPPNNGYAALLSFVEGLMVS